MKPTNWILIGCLSCLALASIGCAKAESYEKPLTPVKVRPVEQQVVSSGATRYSANIQPGLQVDLAFKIGGTVEEVMRVNGRAAQEGDWVEKGTLLARLRDADFAARVKQAQSALQEAQAAQAQVRAQLAEAQAGAEQVKRELERATRLLEADALTRPEFDALRSRAEMGQARIETIRAQLAMTEAKAAGARAQIEEAESMRKDCELRAPISGILLRRNVETGAFIAPGAPACSLADISSVKAVFGVPDVSAATLKPGSPLTVSTEAVRDVAFHGKLTRIAPAADVKTRVFDVEASIPNPRRQLKTGMVVSLQLAGDSHPETVTAVPLNALLQLKEKEGGYALFVVESRDGKQFARMRRVAPGKTIGNMIAIPEGLKAGESVVVSGATLIKDQEEVRVIP